MVGHATGPRDQPRLGGGVPEDLDAEAGAATDPPDATRAAARSRPARHQTASGTRAAASPAGGRRRGRVGRRADRGRHRPRARARGAASSPSTARACRGVRLEDLWAAIEPMWRWPGITTARAALELSDARAESAGESLARMLLEELGLGPIETQFEIRDDVRWARCDLRVGRHLVEFDGFLKYQRRDLDDRRRIDAEQVVWEEKQRQDWLLGYHLGMSRLIWADLWGRPAAPGHGARRPRVRPHLRPLRQLHRRPRPPGRSPRCLSRRGRE